jgi:DNA-binding GntR family transcriptional regulator
MPIPSAGPDSGPRRLLRDVVLDKMLTAIVDGTLEPGERLNDDELVKWLGVSRTPVREAIAQLHSYGLVEIAANRYTRVAERDESVYAEAAELLSALHDLGERLGVDNLDAGSRKALGAALTAASKQIEALDPAGVAALLDVRGELTALSGNSLLSEAEKPLRTRVKFLSPRDADGYQWESIAEGATRVRKKIGS